MTPSSVLDKLKAFDIKQQDVDAWEKALGLEIPTNAAGEKQYSSLHVNLFKNIKKHLVLGRSFEDIKRLIILPKSVRSANEAPDVLESHVSVTPTIEGDASTPVAKPKSAQKSSKSASAKRPAKADSMTAELEALQASIELPTDRELESLVAAELEAQSLEESLLILDPPAIAPPTIETQPAPASKAQRQIIERQRKEIEAAFDAAIQDQYAIPPGGIAPSPSVEHPLKASVPEIGVPQALSGRVVEGIKPFVQGVQQQIANDLIQEQMQKQAVSQTVPVEMGLKKSAQQYLDAAIEGNLAKDGVVNLSDKVASRLDRHGMLSNEAQAEASQRGGGHNANLLLLIDRLMRDKEALQTQLTDIEKLNTHLYQANQLFQDRIKALTEDVESMQQQQFQTSKHDVLQLLNDKSALQKRVIDHEQRYKSLEGNYRSLLDQLEATKRQLDYQCDPKLFVGQWLEQATLQHVAFDHFGVSIEQTRQRLFKVTNAPERVFGPVAIFEHRFDYPSNPLWKRFETLTLTFKNDSTLLGELVTEYYLDETPVARAIYKVTCERKI